MLAMHFPDVRVQPHAGSLHSWVPRPALHMFVWTAELLPCICMFVCTAELLPCIAHQQTRQGLRMPSLCQAAVKQQHLILTTPGAELPKRYTWQADVSKAHQHT